VRPEPLTDACYDQAADAHRVKIHVVIANLGFGSKHKPAASDRTLLYLCAETLYETLGVAQDASERDIKKAYRQKALKLHPDVNKAVSSSSSRAVKSIGSAAVQLLSPCKVPP
jgi:hypothetical protein